MPAGAAVNSMSVITRVTGVDPLTGLKDRSGLPFLNEQFSSRKRPWSLVIIDIDHFKLVNDIYGHLAGDEILAHAGHIIKVSLKSNDHALRFGGDEFIVILPDTGGDSALDLAQRLLFEFGKSEFPGGLKISVSMGIAQSKSADKEISDLVSMADQALYHAKETGRGRFVLADDLKFLRDAEPNFSHMVGRRDELQQLRELVDNATGDSARFCLLTGFQGSGKTKLVNEMLNYCQFRNMPVFTVEAHPVFQEENFLILETVRKALDWLSDSQLTHLKRAVISIERSTAEQLAEFAFRETRRTISVTSDEEKARNRKDLGKILREISRINPFVVVMDNLQWASGKCIQLVAEAVSSVPESNILYIGISRNSDTFKPLKPVWISMPSKRIHLGPLSQPDVRTMVFFAMKTPGIPDEVLSYMMRQSGGNALFLRKLISWGLGMGYLSIGKRDICLWKEPEEEELPGDIFSAIEIMLGTCSATEMKVLKRAALAGDLLDLELLSELTSMDEYNLAEILDRFVELELIKDDGNRYTFSYGVMRSQLISKISPSLRQILHEKTAAFLENREKSVGQDLTAAIAYHFCNSRNNSKAVEYSGKAANESFSQGLHSESIHWYQEYLSRVSSDTSQTGFLRAHINIGILFSITGKAELAEEHLINALSLTDDPVDLCAIFYRLGRNYQRRSMYPSALEYFEKAVSVGDSTGSPSGVLINNMVGALLETSFICRLQNRLHEAADKLEIAGRLLGIAATGIDKALEGMYFARLADLEYETGSREIALEQYRKGLEICIREKDPTGEALILNNMHELYAYNGDYDSMLDSLKKVIKLNNRLDDQLGLAIGYYNLAETYTQLNMLDLAKRYFQMYIELNSKIGNRLGMAYGQLGLGKLSMVNDRNSQAAEYFLNASLIFAELECVEMECDAELNRVKALLSTEDYQACRKILCDIADKTTGHTFQNRLLHFNGVLLHSTEDEQESISSAAAMIKQSIADAGETTPDEIVYMYGNLFRVLEKQGDSVKVIHFLKEALELLGSRISNITSESIRKSILSRSDMEAFLNTCRQKGIASSLLNE